MFPNPKEQCAEPVKKSTSKPEVFSSHQRALLVKRVSTALGGS